MRLGLLAAGALVALGGVWLMVQPGAATGLFPYDDAAIVAEGEALYAEHCAACHGVDLAGQANWQDRDADGYLPAPPHDATGHTWHHPDTQLFLITKHGTEALVGDGYRSNMGAFEGVLSDEEIIAVLAYIKSTWPAQVIRRHNQINEAAGG